MAIKEEIVMEEEINFDKKNAEELVESPKAHVILVVTHKSTINYQKDWIIDLGYSYHMTSDKEK